MAYIQRGATPRYRFKIPLDASLVEDVIITFAQNDIEVFRKETVDCAFEGCFVKIRLSQEETLMLDSEIPVQIQIKLLTKKGDVIPSEEMVLSVKKSLIDEVM